MHKPLLYFVKLKENKSKFGYTRIIYKPLILDNYLYRLRTLTNEEMDSLNIGIRNKKYKTVSIKNSGNIYNYLTTHITHYKIVLEQ